MDISSLTGGVRQRELVQGAIKPSGHIAHDSFNTPIKIAVSIISGAC